MQRNLFKSQSMPSLKKEAVPSTHGHSTRRASTIHLPVEIWLIICDLLGTLDRRALSLTCRPLWCLVNKSAPFVTLNLNLSGLVAHFNIHRRRRVLSVAKELQLHLHPLRPASQQRRRQSSDKFSITCTSFRFILSSLHTSSSLQTLLLSHVQVAPVHQRLILAIQTLRSLMLHYAEFVPTSEALPPSSITSLSLHGVELAATAHVLTLLSNTMEALNCSTNIYDILSNIRLPRLKSLRFTSCPKEVDHFSSLRSFLTLTHLTIDPLIERRVHFPTIPPTILPNLRHLCTSWDLGRLLIVGRPVHRFYLAWELRPSRPARIQLVKDISRFAVGASYLEELQIPLNVPIRETIEVLSSCLPRITRLHLWTLVDKLPAPESFISCQWRRIENRGIQHPSLREVTVGFGPEHRKKAAYTVWEAPEWSLPRTRCDEVFEIIVKKCPVVEVVRIGNLFPWTDEREVPREWVMEWQKGEDGTWVEQI